MLEDLIDEQSHALLAMLYSTRPPFITRPYDGRLPETQVGLLSNYTADRVCNWARMDAFTKLLLCNYPN